MNNTVLFREFEERDIDAIYRWKNDECYAWTVYKHKVALTIETMEKKGLLK